MVSPSPIVCDGTIARAKPSCAISAIFFAWALVSFALVATMPMVVFSPGRGLSSSPDRIALRASMKLPSAAREPATICPVSRIDDVAAGVDGDERGDDQAARQRDGRGAEPALHRLCRRRTCQPWRRRRRRRCLRQSVPWLRPLRRRIRTSASGRIIGLSPMGRSNSTAAGTIGTYAVPNLKPTFRSSR